MQERMETLGSGPDAMRVFVGLPDGPGPSGGIVVAQNAGGLNSYLQGVVRDLVAGGYAAVAPDLYHRQHDDILDQVAKLPEGHADRIPMTLSKVALLQEDEVLEDIAGASALLRSLPEVDAEHVAVIGFCMGGRIAFLAPVRGMPFQASVMYYGAGITSSRDGGPTLLESAPALQCPLLGFFGDDDQNPSSAHREEISTELTRLDKPHEFHHYAGARHGFMEDSNPTLPGAYHEAGAKDAWGKMLAFFAQHLRAPSPVA